MSLAWAEVNIDENQLTISFKILAEDLILFHNPDRDEFYNYEGRELLEAVELHKTLLLSTFYISDDNGKTLKGTVLGTNASALQVPEINVMNLMRHEVIYQLVFKHNTPTWEQFHFHNKRGTANGIPSVIFLTAFYKGQKLVSNAEITSERSFTLKAVGKNTSENPSELTSSYVSVDLAGLRHELTIPMKTFLSFTGKTEVSPENVLDYFKKKNFVFYDEKQLDPRLSFLKKLEESTNENSLIYIDLFYPSNAEPTSILMNWSDYNWRFRWFNSKIAAGDSTFTHVFSRFQKDWKWKKLEKKD